MFSIPAILALLAFIFVRPQEIFPVLAKVPFLYLLCALSLFGLVVDLKLRLVKPIATPQFMWALLFLVWVLISIVLFVPPQVLQQRVIAIGVSFLLFLVLSQGVQTFRSLQVVTGTLAVLTIFVSLVAIHQGSAPLGCVMLEGDEIEHGIPDGRSCDERIECYGPEAEPGAEYICEHIGLFGTSTIQKRVRWRGVLKDPNELAMTMSCGLALIIAFAARKRTMRWLFIAGIASLVIMAALFYSKSRGGQLVFLGVLGVYFVKRLGWKGIAIGIVLAAPVLLMGGRGGEEASMSSMQRYEAWREGLHMLTHSPFTGVGHGMFAEVHYLTAHNSYILAAGELGFPGYLLWTILLYMSVKIVWCGVRDLADVPGAAVARTWAMGILAAMAGLMIGMMFLSFSYHYILWIYMGVCGGFYSATKSHLPEWRVRFGLKDMALVLVADMLFLVALDLLLRVKGF